MERPLVLVTSRFVMDRIRSTNGPLNKLSDIVQSDDIDEAVLRNTLQRVRAMLILEWPRFLRSETDFAGMRNLGLIQSVLAGVDHIPFRMVPETIFVCSNAGGFTDAVPEHAWSLILTAGKAVDQQYHLLKRGRVPKGYALALAKKMKLLNGGVFGAIGLGSIGKRAAEIARAFGMKVYALTRTGKADFTCEFVGDKSDLHRILRQSDVLMLAVPLTKHTRNIIGKSELEMMKDDAILVNVARGDLVDQQAIYEHLKAHPNFSYVTDVWWFGPDGREAFAPSHPLFKLSNFLCTPHTSGPLAFEKGKAVSNAVENVIRFLKSEIPQNIVRREDYL